MPVPLFQSTADLFRVLGHPVRIRVLELLAERERTAADLLAEIPVEAGSLSQQLAVLRRAGLTGQRREGGTVVHTLTVAEVRDVLVAAHAALAALPVESEVIADLRGPATPPTGAISAGARRPIAG